MIEIVCGLFLLGNSRIHTVKKTTLKHVLQMSGKINLTEVVFSSFLSLLLLRGFESLSKYVHR